MAWSDQLVDASFRGVPFFVDRAALQTGRRTVVHEFPGRTTPLVEDLGRAPRRWQLEMFVLGDNYLYDRDQLRLALERPGPGELILPTMGTVRAVAEGIASFAEDTSVGRICRVTATFIEATDQLRVASMEFPALDLSEACAAVQTQAALAVSADIDAARAEAIKSAASVDGAAELAAVVEDAKADASLADRVRACAATLRDAQRKVAAVGDRASRMASDAAALARAPSDFVGEIFSTAGDMVDAAISVGGIVGSLASGLDFGWRLRDLLRGTVASVSAAQQEAAAAPRETPSQVFQGAAASTVSRATAAAVATAAARASIGLEFGSSTSALELSEALCEAIDLSLADPPATPAAEALRSTLRDLRSASVRYLRSVVDELPKIGRYTPQATVPDLVIAQRLYGDARRHAEIRRLNDLPNPLFCSADVPLEVLSGE